MSTDKSIPCKQNLVIQVTHSSAAKLLLTKLRWLQARKELAKVELLKVCELPSSCALLHSPPIVPAP